MTADYHLHSCFSGDSETPTEEVVRSGLEKGLSLLCLTEHFDPDYPYADVCMDLDAPAYFAEARRLQALYESRIEIRVGAELGLQPRLGTFLDSWLEQNMAEGLSFDFLIGSTHLVDGTDPYYPEFWNVREPEASVGRFLDITLENVRAFPALPGAGRRNHHHRLRRPYPRVHRLSSGRRERSASKLRFPLLYHLPGTEAGVYKTVIRSSDCAG